MYRSKEEREESLARFGGKSDKTDWFHKTGATTVITVPSTVNSKLAEKVREALKAAPDPSGCSTLVREQPGRVSVRIRVAKTRGILILGRGRRKKTFKVNKNILKRKHENFSPFFLTFGGGED